MTWRELGDDPTQRRVIDALADARLLTVDDNSVEIAHEAIIQSWPLLCTAGSSRHATICGSDSASTGLLTSGTASRATRPSSTGARHSRPHWPGRSTTRASSVRLATDFLDTSEDVRQAEAEVAEAERRRSRRVRRIAVSALAVLAGAAIVATAIALVALQRSRADERKASERLANLLGTQALGEARRDPLLSLALATESIARSEQTVRRRRTCADRRSDATGRDDRSGAGGCTVRRR